MPNDQDSVVFCALGHGLKRRRRYTRIMQAVSVLICIAAGELFLKLVTR